ncbi:hypothetical protein AB1Y20_017357 [Prymnesium parvum]|uniref:EF-hand domain-containing protein n=1 Tax=Prymnesium parvum TaxID=97485 RepID=A0AB34JK93_PRYPA
MQEVSKDVQDAFSYFDRDRSGFIDARELESALARLGLPSSSKETAAVLKKYDATSDRGLDLAEFDRLVQDVRKFKAAQSAPPNVSKDVQDAFSYFDRDRSGFIDVRELESALARLGLPSSSQETAAVLKKYDATSDRGLDLAEFDRLVQDVRKFKAAQSAPPNVSKDVQDAFSYFDRDRSGFIDVRELESALARLGLPSSSKETAAVLKKYDATSDRGLDLAEFDRLVQDVRKFKAAQSAPPNVSKDVQDAFSYFDRDRSGFIDVRELESALARLGLPSSSKETAAVLKKYDATSDRGLDLAEFDRLVQDVRKFKAAQSAPPNVSKDVQDAFSYFDRDRSGFIDVRELESALARLGLPSSSKETAAVLKKYDATSDRGLDLAEFDRLVQDVRKFKAAQSAPPNVSKDVQDAFSYFDRDRSGFIDVRELESALARLGLPSSSKETAAVLKKYDATSDRGLDLAEFDRLVQDVRKFKAAQSAPPTVSKDVQDAFSYFDRDRSGFIDVRELQSALARLGLPCSSQETAAVLKKYDATSDRGLDLAEFDRLVQDVRKFKAAQSAPPNVSKDVQDAFSYFDRDRSGFIDVRELESALARLGLPCSSQETAAVLKKYDATSDRGLDLAEFDRLVQDVRKFKAAQRNPTDIDIQIRRAFEQFDVDNSGDISVLELRNALDKLGLKTTTDQAIGILQRYDANRSRRLGLDEFAQLVQDVLKFTGAYQEVPEKVRRVFERYDRDRAGAMEAADLRAALQALGVPADTLLEASSLLAIFDAHRNARISLFEFSKVCDEIIRHQFGSSIAMQPLLLQRDTSKLLERHRKAIDELFAVYASTIEATGTIPYNHTIQLCQDFNLIRNRILSQDDVITTLARMHSISVSSSMNPSRLRPIARERFNELLFRLALQATEKDPKLQKTEPHIRLQALLEALLLTNPIAFKRQVGGLHLLRAAAAGAVERMSELLSAGAAVDLKDGNGASALHMAAFYGHIRAVTIMIGHGASLQDTTTDGWTPLHFACEYGHLNVVRELLRKGASVDTATSRGWTALHRAALDGHLEVVEELLSAHAPLTARDKYGDTPLHDAARNGHLDVVQTLIRAGAYVDVTNFEGKTALDLARENARAGVVQLFESIFASLPPPSAQLSTNRVDHRIRA